MKRQQSMPFRKPDRRFRLEEAYIIRIKKTRAGDLVMPLPDDIIRAYRIEDGDAAIFSIISRNCFLLMFVKKTMCGKVMKI